MRNIRALAAFLVAATLALPLDSWAASPSARSSQASLTERQKAIHVLNRLAFGPRPGDVDEVLRIGVAAWIGEQLAPERISDAAVAKRLESLPTLAMSTAELFDRFERPIREARQARRRQQSERGESMKNMTAAAAEDEVEKIRAMVPPEERPRRVIEELIAARIFRAAASERQLNEVLVDFWMNHFNVYAAKGLDRVFVTSFERDVVRPGIWGRFEDLLVATAKSPAMLLYLDNARSVADEANRPSRRVPRDGAYGRALAARLAARGRDPEAIAKAQANAPRGLNENYARELMELHTLGVDGGYTQKDVTELARLLTGWSIDPRDGAFVFRPRMHDVEAKTLLGRRFPAGGRVDEGEEAIRMLARQPATARHLAAELCRRLVSDEPPAFLVDRVARRFLATGGDLRETVRVIVTSPEFFDPAYYRAKIKSPFEYAVSAIRAAGGSTDGGLPIARAIAQMGEPLYLCQPPTGYSDASSAWVNTGALVARLNFALTLAANKLPGSEVHWDQVLRPEETADPKRAIAALARVLTGDELSSATVETIERHLEPRAAPADDPAANTQVPLIAGLVLGSPEFQRQ